MSYLADWGAPCALLLSGPTVRLSEVPGLRNAASKIQQKGTTREKRTLGGGVVVVGSFAKLVISCRFRESIRNDLSDCDFRDGKFKLRHYWVGYLRRLQPGLPAEHFRGEHQRVCQHEQRYP